MKLVARFYDPEEAHIAAGFLRAQGLEVTVADAQALGVMPELRVGLGGYRLMAPERDANLAQRYLADIKYEQSKGPACTRCGGTRLTRVRDLRFPALFGGLSGLLMGLIAPFAPPTGTWRCGDCGLRQKLAEDEDTEQNP